MTEQADILQFGQPEDARGWRQFLIEHRCPEKPGHLPDPKFSWRNALPCLIWVDSSVRICPHCGGPARMLHPSSVTAIAEHCGVPLQYPADRYHICLQTGVFIE